MKAHTHTQARTCAHTHTRTPTDTPAVDTKLKDYLSSPAADKEEQVIEGLKIGSGMHNNRQGVEGFTMRDVLCVCVRVATHVHMHEWENLLLFQLENTHFQFHKVQSKCFISIVTAYLPRKKTLLMLTHHILPSLKIH